MIHHYLVEIIRVLFQLALLEGAFLNIIIHKFGQLDGKGRVVNCANRNITDNVWLNKNLSYCSFYVNLDGKALKSLADLLIDDRWEL